MLFRCGVEYLGGDGSERGIDLLAVDLEHERGVTAVDCGEHRIDGLQVLAVTGQHACDERPVAAITVSGHGHERRDQTRRRLVVVSTHYGPGLESVLALQRLLLADHGRSPLEVVGARARVGS